jgi:flagellar motility protein MotE (MotC chaperone)
MSGYQDFFKTRRNLASKTKPLNKAPSPMRQKKSSDSRWLALVASILAGGSIWYLGVGEDQTTKIFNKVEVSIFGPAQAESEGAKTADVKSKAEEKNSTSTSPEVKGAKAPKRAWTDEEVSLFTKLEERKKQLDAREANLDKLDEELQKQKEDLEKRLAALEDVRAKIATKLEDKVKSDGDKVNSLVSVYSNMKPGQAAILLQGLNEDLAVEILTKMKNKNAAEILNTMEPEKAKHLTERFAGFKEAANSN